MTKSPDIIKYLDKLIIETFGRSLSTCHKEKICLVCGGSANSFRNKLSRKEWEISGLCEKCQDETFKGDNQ